MELNKMSIKELEEMHRTLSDLIYHEGCFGRSDIRDFHRVSQEIKERQEAEANERLRA